MLLAHYVPLIKIQNQHFKSTALTCLEKCNSFVVVNNRIKKYITFILKKKERERERDRETVEMFFFLLADNDA